MQTIEASFISNIFSKVFNSFLKSMEGMFKAEGNSKTSESKGDICITQEFPPLSPPIDETTGKALPKNVNPFEIEIFLTWPKKEPLTRKDAKDIASDSNVWVKEIWAKAEDITAELSVKGRNRTSYKNLKKEDLDQAIQSYIEKNELGGKLTWCTRIVHLLYEEIDEKQKDKKQGSDEGENTNASRRLNVSLKKVVGKTETSIQLIKINANYDLREAVDDITCIVSDDDFVCEMPENEEIDYTVTSDEEEYDVNPCEDFCCNDSIDQMIYETLCLACKLRILGMAGLRDHNSYEVLDNGGLSYAFDGILSVLKDGLSDNGCNLIPGVEINVDAQEICNDGSIEATAAGLLEGYLEALNILYDCLSNGLQYRLNQHVSYLEDITRGLRQK